MLVCHPRLVQTGLDLAVVAALHAHREKCPVKVVFVAYRNTLPAEALKLAAYPATAFVSSGHEVFEKSAPYEPDS